MTTSARKTSTAGVAFIARWESLVLRVYTDSAGVSTIGYGHALKPGEAFPNGVSKDEALALLASDVSIAEANVNADVTSDISQNQFDSLVSFTFNCGGEALKLSSVLAYTNRSAWSLAARAFMLWDKRKDPATGILVVDKGLLSRRMAEAKMYLTPDQPQAPDDTPTDPETPHAIAASNPPPPKDDDG